MRIVVDMEYLTTDRQSGKYKYRRRVPRDLVRFVGKREYSISLKTKDAQAAARKYQEVHSGVEKELQAIRAMGTQQAEYSAVMGALKRNDLLKPGEKSVGPISFDAEEERFKAFTEAMLSTSDDREFELLAEAKFFGVERPPVTLDDAISSYLGERADRDNERDLTKQTNLVARKLREVMGEANPALEAIDVDSAYAFRDQLVSDGVSNGTIRRRISTVKALMEFALQRHGLGAKPNPFKGLRAPKSASDRSAKEDRLPLSTDEIRKCTAAILSRNSDIVDVWHLMMATGARPNELLGLQWQDVVLDQATPHIIIRPNDIRRIKNDRSRRKVPLVAPIASRLSERVHSRREGQPISADGAVFRRYTGPNGPNTASALMSNAMRQAKVWEKGRKVPYSLRHSHTDWCRRVAPATWANLIHGHSDGSIAQDYGGDDMLDRLSEYIDAAVREAGVADLLEAIGSH